MTEKFENLVKWVEENGGYVDKDLYLFVDENGDRCLKIKKPKLAKELLAVIPKECNISGKTWIETCLNLLSEFPKEEKSFYHPYLEMLPKMEMLKDHPFFKFEEKEVETIKSIHFESGTRLKNLYLNIELLKVVSSDLAIPGMYKTEKWLKYILLLCNTRSWGSIGMIPIIDLLQHTQQGDNCNTVSFGDRTHLHCKQLNINDSLSLCYREGSISDFYISYGIPILDINYINAVLEIPTLTEKQKKLIGSIVTLYFSDVGLDLNTLKQLRVITMKENEDFNNNLVHPELNKRCAQFVLPILEKSRIKQVPVHDRYKIFYNIIAKHNEIIDKSIKEFKSFLVQ